MQRLVFVEIDIARCSHTYGSSPCVASIPTTGSRKCYNSPGTCQDSANFNDTGVTIRFGMDATFYPDAIEFIPCLSGIQFTPSILSLGENLGQRASVKVQLRDHPDSDTGPHGDKYLADRDFDPYRQGTFFGKLRARHPSFRGRALRVIHGEVGQSIGDMDTHHYIIDSFDGPLPDGSFAITAKDVLKLADGDRALAPAMSNGFVSVGIDDNDMSFTLAPSGIGNAEYRTSGKVALGGKEIVSYTRSGDAMTIVARGLNGTTAVAHAAQDRVQEVLEYSADDPATIIADLLETYAGLDAAFIPEDEWLIETEAFLQRLYSAVIAEPTSVEKLIDELIEQAALAVWWDDRQQKIRLQVLRAIATDAAVFSEDVYLENTVQAKDQPDKRISQVITYFGQINPLRRVDEPDNYRSSEVTRDAVTEASYGSPAIKTIFSRWIPSGARTTATRLNAILIGRFKNPPQRFNFDAFRDGETEVTQGQGARIEGWFIQDDTGAAAQAPIQVTRVGPEADRFKVEAEGMIFDIDEEEIGDRVVILDVNENNVNFRSKYDNQYPEPQSGDEVLCIIQEGVIIGSTSASLLAFEMGDWPDGVVLAVQVDGRMQGKGGPGGRGAWPSTSTAGGPGGDAFKTRVPVTIRGAGKIYAGGGGGGGGADGYFAGWPGGGAGGGQGQTPGLGGTAGSSPGGFPAEPGDPGTADAPGEGGLGFDIGGPGGDGGGPGQAGSAGEYGAFGDGGGFGPSPGGAGGRAIDGDSYVTEEGSLDIQGARVN